MSSSGGTWGLLIGKLDERIGESGENCNMKFAFPAKLGLGKTVRAT